MTGSLTAIAAAGLLAVASGTGSVGAFVPALPLPEPPARLFRTLPEEAWLAARVGDLDRWATVEMEEEGLWRVPPTRELRLAIDRRLSEYRVRLLDAHDRSIPNQGTSEYQEGPRQQVYTMRFATPLGPGPYRLVIDAPLGGVLRDGEGHRLRGQRFRLLVSPEALPDDFRISPRTTAAANHSAR